MTKCCFKTLLISVVFTVGVNADNTLKKSAAALQQASFVLTNYAEGKVGYGELQKASTNIEATWDSFVQYQGVDHPLAQDLSLIHARSVTAAKKKEKIVSAWQIALNKLPFATKSGRKVSLYLEAANAATFAENYKVAENYFSLARSLAVMRSENADKAQLYMRLHELKATGSAMQWRPLRDALSDLRKYSESFALWSLPRLEALLGEAELRVQLQPNEEKKRTDLAELKAQLVLSEKGLGGGIPGKQLTRLRSLYYVLEDHWQL